MMDNHILDNPVWTSLTSIHSDFSVGCKNARRFESDISPLGAAKDESAKSLLSLAKCIPDNGYIIAAQANPIICPSGTYAVDRNYFV